MLSNTAVPKYYGEFRDKVMAGLIPVNEEVSMQMNRIDRLIEDPRYYYDDKAIDGYVNFCNTELTLEDGRPLVLLDSFKLWAEDVLSWFYFSDEETIDPRTGRSVIKRKKKRLRHTQYLIVARGNAKSLYNYTHHAYGLLVDTATTNQVAAGPTKAQGMESISPFITAMAKGRGPLIGALTNGNAKSRSEYTQPKLVTSKDGVVNKITNSTLQAYPMRVSRMQGGRTKYASVDEWLSVDIKEDVVEALRQSATKGDNAEDYLILATSSEGTVRNSIGDSIKLNLLSILRGDYIDESISIWYYRLDDVSEVADPSKWMKASPNLGITVSYDTYFEAVKMAENNLLYRNDILAKRFGIPVEGYTRFFTYEETLTHPQQNFDHLPCSLGMDASQGDDFWAFTFLFPLGNGRYGVKTRSYVAKIRYDKLPMATRLKYDEFINEDTLCVMDTNVLNWSEIYEDLMGFIYKHDYSVLTFGYDPYNAGPFVERWSMEHGDYGVEIVRQGSRTESVPLGEIKNTSESRMLIFDEELMKFSMGNSIVLEDNNHNRKLSKERANEKIDNVAALLDAWVAHTRNQDIF